MLLGENRKHIAYVPPRYTHEYWIAIGGALWESTSTAMQGPVLVTYITSESDFFFTTNVVLVELRKPTVILSSSSIPSSGSA